MHAPVRVFFQPKFLPHDPELYAFDRIAEPVAATDLDDAAHGRYRRDGYLLVRGLLADDRVVAGHHALEAMALADDPACEQLWYERFWGRRFWGRSGLSEPGRPMA